MADPGKVILIEDIFASHGLNAMRAMDVHTLQDLSDMMLKKTPSAMRVYKGISDRTIAIAVLAFQDNDLPCHETYDPWFTHYTTKSPKGKEWWDASQIKRAHGTFYYGRSDKDAKTNIAKSKGDVDPEIQKKLDIIDANKFFEAYYDLQDELGIKPPNKQLHSRLGLSCPIHAITKLKKKYWALLEETGDIDKMLHVSRARREESMMLARNAIESSLNATKTLWIGNMVCQCNPDEMKKLIKLAEKEAIEYIEDKGKFVRKVQVKEIDYATRAKAGAELAKIDGSNLNINVSNKPKELPDDPERVKDYLIEETFKMLVAFGISFDDYLRTMKIAFSRSKHSALSA